MSQHNAQTVKVVILGDSGVGKSSLALRFVTNDFKPYSESTIGASYMSKRITIDSMPMSVNDFEKEEESDKQSSDDADSNNREMGGQNVSSIDGNDTSPPTSHKRIMEFKIWDTAGQEKYRSLATMYYRGAGAALLVFDVTKASSFDVLQSWVNELKFKGPPDIVMGLCGNKCDLNEEGDERQVSLKDAQEYAKKLGCFYLETSAKKNVNVLKAFEEIAKRVPPLEEEFYDLSERPGINVSGKLDLGVNNPPSSGFLSSFC